MKTLNLLLIIPIMLLTFGLQAQSDKDKEIMDDAVTAKEKLMAIDEGISTFFENSTGYAIFPNVGEGALIIGGASGNGVLYENGRAIGMADLKKVDFGPQIGGRAMLEVVFFETAEALEAFKTDEYTFSAEVTAVAVASGVSENANYSDGVLVFTMPKAGLMADASVGGQKFEYKSFEDMK